MFGRWARHLSIGKKQKENHKMKPKRKIKLLKVHSPPPSETSTEPTMFIEDMMWGIKLEVMDSSGSNVEIWIHSEQVKALIHSILDLKIET